jgi:hypothetical protein
MSSGQQGQVAPSSGPRPRAQCTDENLARALGVPLEGARNGLRSFDAAFGGPRGLRFRDQVRDVAARVGLDPGSLASNLLSEVQRRSVWTNPVPVESHIVGVDYWHEERPKVRSVVRAAANIRESIVRDSRGRPVHFVNERGRDTGPVYRFTTGRDGMLALASSIAYRDQRLRRSMPPGAYDRLPAAVRFAAVRLAFNAGTSRGIRMVRRAAAGQDPLVRSGAGSPQRPSRAATIRAAQAIHLSQAVFGIPQACP